MTKLSKAKDPVTQQKHKGQLEDADSAHGFLLWGNCIGRPCYESRIEATTGLLLVTRDWYMRQEIEQHI